MSITAWGRRVAMAVTAAATVLTIGCGGGSEDDSFAAPVELESPTPTPPVPTPVPTAAPVEFRVAYLNLMSPISVDSTDTVAGDTFDARLALVVEEMQDFRPDVIGFSEAAWTEAHGSAVAKLSVALKMEPIFVQANPWFASQTEAQNKDLARQIGFDEGELILVRSDRWVVAGATPTWLNPRTSETEGRAALHVKLRGPEPAREIDVFITHLTGGGDRVRELQARGFADFVARQRGTGPAVVMADLSAGPESAAYAAIAGTGLLDPLAGEDEGTCCRESVLGEQPELTTRTDFLFAAGWPGSVAGILADRPGEAADGTPLYASDHNGVWAVFPLQ